MTRWEAAAELPWKLAGLENSQQPSGEWDTRPVPAVLWVVLAQDPRGMGQDWLSRSSLLMSVCWERGAGAGRASALQKLCACFLTGKAKLQETLGFEGGVPEGSWEHEAVTPDPSD